MDLVDKLLEIDGLGKSKVDELIKSGIKRISDLHKYNIPLQTKLYLQLKPSKTISSSYISTLDNKLNKYTKAYCIVGSYRRKKPFSRDVDILITSKLDNFIKHIRRLGDFHIYSHGDDKISGYLVSDIVIKIDVFKVDKDKLAFMKLYSTGSKEWNIYMRYIAKSKGYLLNQNGLKNIKSGRYIPCKTEKCIFKKLDIPYKAPKDREIELNIMFKK